MDEASEFQRLVMGHLDSLYSYGLVLTQDHADAEDLLQDTMLRAFRSFFTFNRDCSCKVWLFQIMKNIQIDRHRRRRSKPVEEEFEDERTISVDSSREVDLFPPPLDPEKLLIRHLMVEEIRDAIRRLPSLWREVVQLRDIEGLSYAEIAQVLGKPIGTVMSRLYRGRNQLRMLLLEHAPGQNAMRRYGL